MPEPQSKAKLQQCKICSAPATYVNFGAMSCSSCKMFFKRNAELGQKHFRCEFNENCDLTMFNRRSCSSCRLAKCFRSGMQLFLIRGARLRKNQKRQIKESSSLALATTISRRHETLNLLEADQSGLTTVEWTLLSNLIHCYDEHCSLNIAKEFQMKQNSLPPKLRFRIETMNEFLSSDMTRVQRICQRNLDYLSLRSEDQSTLLHQTVRLRSSFGTTFILHQTGLLSNLWFYQSGSILFSADVMEMARFIGQTFDTDIVFLKLILSILLFSTTHYTVYRHSTKTTFVDDRRIHSIHDMYIEITWKYLVYRYTFDGAVRKFAALLRTLFNIHRTIVQVIDIEIYRQIIDSVVEQTEEILHLK